MHKTLLEHALILLMVQAEVVLAGGAALVVELLVLTPQDKPRFLASTEYLIHPDRSSHMRFPLIKRDPLLQTKSLGQALRLFIEQAEEVVLVELLDPTPQERPRFLASTEYLIHGDRSPHKRFPLIKRIPRWQTKSSEQTLRLCHEQADGVLIVELLASTPHERPRFLASTAYLMY